MSFLNFKLGRIEKTDEESRAVPGYDGQYVSCGGHFLETPDGREFECAYDSTFNCADCVCNGGPYDPRYPYCERGDAESVYRRLEEEPLLHIAARRLKVRLQNLRRSLTWRTKL